jgi:hypothetical protein
MQSLPMVVLWIILFDGFYQIQAGIRIDLKKSMEVTLQTLNHKAQNMIVKQEDFETEEGSAV